MQVDTKCKISYQINILKFFLITILSIFFTLTSLKADTFQIDLSSHISMPVTTVEVSQPFQTNITIKNENTGSTILDGKGASIKYHIPSSSSFTSGNYTGTGWSCQSAVDASGDLKCTYGQSLTNGQTSNLLVITLTAPSSTGTKTPSVTVTATSTDANTSNDTSSTTVEFGKSNLHATKTASKTKLQLGETFSYIITLSNPNNGTNPTVKARNVTISDTLPSQIQFISPLSDTSCSQSNGTITCNGIDLAAGNTRSVTINVKAIAGGTNIKNTATINADSSDYNSMPLKPNVSVDVELADITLTQSLVGGISSTSAAVNSNVAYRFHVVNNGTSPASDINLSDTLPSGVTYIGFSSTSNWSCTDNSPTINCTLKDTNLTNGESSNLDINVTMPKTHGSITNSATASTSSPESNTSNNTSSLITQVKGADLNIEKTPKNGSTDIGTNYTYTIKVTNVGEADAKNVKVTDTLDPKMTYSDDNLSCGSSLNKCNLGDVSAGSNKSFTVTVTMPSDYVGDVTNSVNVTTDTDQENNTQTSDTATTHITGPNLNITKDANVSEVGLGKTFSYSINIKNVNSANATDAVIEDQLPSGVTVTNISPDGWTCPKTPITGTFDCNKSTVAGGANDTLVFTATAPTNTTGDIKNTATISHSLNSNDGSDSADVNVTGVVLSIDKVGSPTAVVGGLIDYNITVANTSHSDADDLILTDDLSSLGSGYTVHKVFNNNVDWNCSGVTTLTCTKNLLTAEGASSTIHFNVNVPNDAMLGMRTNTASVTTTTTPQPVASDSFKTDIQGSDIVVVPPTTKTAVANENVIFTVKVRNDGSATAKDVNLTNSFNTTGITKGDFANIKIDCDNDGTYDVTSAPYTCQLGDIPKNGIKTVKISATAPNYDSNFPGHTDITNNSTAVTSSSESNTANNSKNWSVENHGADIVIFKDANVTDVAVNGLVTYDLYITNQWEANATNIQLTDNTLGTGSDKFTFISGSLNYNSSDWDCTLNSSTNFTCSYKHTLTYNQTTSHITIQAKAPNLLSAIDNIRINEANISTDTAERETATSNKADSNVTIRGADLNISKSVSPSTVKLQQGVTYTITVTNNGLADAKNTDVNDTLPNGFTNISTNGCTNDSNSVSGNSIHCTLGDLAQGESKTFTIATNAPNTNGTYTNTAVTGSDTLEKNTADNTSSVNLIVQGADLIPHKAAPNRVAGNSTFTYTISLENNGSSTAYGAEINDTIPTNDGHSTTYVAGSLTTLDSDWTCSISGQNLHCYTIDSNLSIPSGYNHNIASFQVKAGPAHYWIHNTVVTDTNTSESNYGNNSYQADTEVINVDLAARKLINGNNYGANENYVAIGADINYTLQVRNASTVDINITDVNFTDVIPSNLTNINITPDSGFNCNTTPLHFPLGNIEGGDTLTCTMKNGTTNPLQTSEGWITVATITAKAIDTAHFDINNENNNSIINRYKAETSLSDQDLGNNAPTGGDGYLHTNTLVRGANMSITKEVLNNLNTVGANKPFQYILTVKNWPRDNSTNEHDRPSTTATNIIVKDVLPNDVNFTSATGTNWNCNENSHIITCTYNGTIAPGNTFAEPIEINVTAPNSDAQILTNEANVTNDTPELVRLLPDNNDSVQVTTAGTDITVSKNGPATAGMSDTVTYTVKVTNSSAEADAQNVYVVDTLPNGATYEGNISNPHWTTSASTGADGNITFSYDQDLLMSTKKSFSFDVKLPHYTGTVRNHVEAFTSTAETSSPNIANKDTDILGADLVFKNTPSQSPNPVGAYGTHQYYISIKNQGLSDAKDINVTFDFNNMSANPGWSDINGSGTGWSCDPYDINNTKLICHLSTLARSSDSSTLTINSTAPNYNGDITNHTTVIGEDDTNATTGETEAVTTTIKGSDLKIKKYANDPDPQNPNNAVYYDDNITIGVGKPINFKFMIKNNNLGLAKDITLSDTFPVGFSDINITNPGDWNCLVTGLKLTCTRSKLSPDTNASNIIVSAKTPSSIEIITNTSDINTSTKETDYSNNTNSVKIKLEGATLNADFNASITKVAMNEIFYYKLDITNTGKNDGIDINTTDKLPNDFTYMDNNGSDSGWTCSQSSNTVKCNQPLIPAYSGNSILILHVKAPQNKTGVYKNSIDINSTSIKNPITAYAPDVRVIGADIAVDINATPTDVLEDRNVTYNINVKDINISTAKNVTLKQTFDKTVNALYIKNGSSDCSLTDANQSVTCSFGDIAYNADKNITIVATMPYAGSNDTVSLKSTVETNTTSAQENQVNHTAKATVTVYKIKPIVDYIFEECKWNKSDDVIDSISGINGTAYKGAKPINYLLAKDSNNFSPKWRVGKFDGNDDYIEIPNNSKLQITKNQTICVWVRPTKFSKRRNIIAKAYGGEGTITQETDGSLSYYYGTAGKNQSPYQGFSSDQNLELNKWSHICLVRDLDNMKLKWYINNVKTHEGNAHYSNAVASNKNLLIGAGYTNNFKGYIDNVEIYNIALDGRAVKDIYNFEKDGKNYDGTDLSEPLCKVDLSVTKSVTPRPLVGAESNMAYTITVKNNSSEPLTTGFTLQDTLPSGLTLADTNLSTADVTCVGTYDFNCTLPASVIMKENDTRTITLSATAPNSTGESLTNNVDIATGVAGTVGQPESTTSNNHDSATNKTIGTDLSVTKTATLDNNGSNIIHYNIIVKNLSTITTAREVSLKDTYDSRLTLVSFSGNCSTSVGNSFNCTLPNMPAGSEYNITSTMLVDTNGTDIINDVNVTSHTADTNLSNNYASVSVDINTTGANAPVTLKDGFRKHISTNNYGNMIAIGNTILKANNQTGSVPLVDINSSYVNVSLQPLDSSSATLHIPENNVTIEYAGLYWGGHIKGKDANDTLSAVFNKVSLKTPSGATYTIVGGKQENSNFSTDDNITGLYRFKRFKSSIARLYYASEANVTSILRNENTLHGSVNGVFTVSDLNVSSGLDNTASFIPDDSSPSHWSYFNSGFFGGWELVVIYSVNHRLYRSVRYKNSTLYDGFKVLMPRSPGQAVSLDINVGGFITPQTGDIESSLFSMVFAGDKTLPYESMSVDNNSSTPHLVKEDTNNTNNIFNDDITLKNIDNTPIDRDLSLSYNPGVDLDEFSLTSNYNSSGVCVSSPCYLNNGQTSTKINLKVKESSTETSSGSNQYAAQYAFVDMLGFNTQIFTPDFIDSYKECFKRKEPGSLLNHDWVPCSAPTPTIHRGSIIKYRITMINSGTDDAINVHMSDVLPKEVDFNGTCSSINQDINATNIYPLPDGSNDNLFDYNDTLRTISGDCVSSQYDQSESVRNECIKDLKAILVDGNNTVPLNSIPQNLINHSYNNASCSVDNNITTLKFDYSTFPKKSVTWIDFYTKINGKAVLGKSFQNFVSINFTNKTLSDAGINNLQTQQSAPVNSGTVTFDWSHIVANVRDMGRTSVGTKIVNRPFDLNITLSGINPLDIDSDGNTTMKISNLQLVDVYNNLDANISNTIKSTTASVTGTILNWETNDTNYAIASKKIGFRFDLTVFFGDYNSTKHYPHDFNSSATYTGDVFSTRPKDFAISFPDAAPIGGYTVVTAASDMNLSVKAVDNYDVNSSYDYNNTLSKAHDINISLDSNFSTNSNCIDINELNVSNLSFTNGNAMAQNTKYSNVGVIRFDLTDSNWTAVDQTTGDCISNSGTNTPNTNGLIGCNVEGNSTSVVFKPDHFDFNNTSVLDHGNTFTYMITDPLTDRVYGKLSADAVSKNKDGNITTFFSNSCFADNVNVQLSYGANSKSLNDLNISMVNESNLTNILSDSNLSVNDNNFSTIDQNSSFSSGVGAFIIRAMISRNKTTPLEPAIIKMNDLNGSIHNYLGITGVDINSTSSTTIPLPNKLHFIYGRIQAPNYSSTTGKINAKIYYEGYCKDCNKSLYPSLGKEGIESIYWYINKDQNGLNDGNISNFVQPSNTQITIAPLSSGAITSGSETHTITYNGTTYPYGERVDMNASSWLIYNPYDANATISSFFVTFTKYNDWAGIGTTGKTVDLNISTKSSKRLEW